MTFFSLICVAFTIEMLFIASGCDGAHITHAVVFVGYGTTGVTKYWKLRNSLGPFWDDGVISACNMTQKHVM